MGVDCIYPVIDSLNDKSIYGFCICRSNILWLILEWLVEDGKRTEEDTREQERMLWNGVTAFGTGCYFQPVPKNTLGTGWFSRWRRGRPNVSVSGYWFKNRYLCLLSTGDYGCFSSSVYWGLSYGWSKSEFFFTLADCLHRKQIHKMSLIHLDSK